jgi:predicted flap endonuclease-1-like 5' DNA nuclease
MLALALQTLLLMSAAYCLGAALACLVRRSFFASAARAPRGVSRHVEPLPEVDPDVVGVRRFLRAGHEADSSPSPQPAPAVAPRPAAPAEAGDAAPQELQRIHAIDAATEAALNRLGINRYDAISRWSRGDLDRIAPALGIRRQRMNRENWIEQAQMLATGVETHYARRRARGETASATPSADQGERRRLVAQPPPVAAPPAPTRRAAPSMPPAAIAAGPRGGAPSRAPSAGIAASVSAPPRVSERAAFARAEPAAAKRSEPVASPATALPARSGATSARSAPSHPPAAAAIPAPVRATPSPLEPARPVRPPPATGLDNLQRIRGIDAAMAQRLAAAGVSRYAQIATWSAAEVARYDRDLAGAGRIARENWIEQAQVLMRGGDTTFSRAFDRGVAADVTPPSAVVPKPGEAVAEPASDASSAPPARPFLLGTLRSVRSQAYQNPEPGPEAAHRVGSHNRVVRSAPPQDLKRIRGIGVLIERRLNAMQIATYEQIANWTAEDIERVSRMLDFKGRIERENWVEQARILASGGATEFSRRVDRGDVETGRYRP